MTIQELKKKLEKIPANSVINRARRAAILREICRLQGAG